jgi:hypothetical protein
MILRILKYGFIEFDYRYYRITSTHIHKLNENLTGLRIVISIPHTSKNASNI